MKSLWCDHLNEMNVLSCGTVFYYAIQSESVDKSYGVTIQMKDTEQYLPVVLFIVLYKVVLTFQSVDKILWCNVTIQMKATEQYFPVILFTMLYKVVLTFESVDEILWYDHSNESY